MLLVLRIKNEKHEVQHSVVKFNAIILILNTVRVQYKYKQFR